MSGHRLSAGPGAARAGATLALLVAALLALASARLAGGARPDAGPVAAAQVERLGSPFTTGAYARNVWDMQLHRGRIYLGHGNSSNEGPDANAGPIPIWSYDLAAGRFVNEHLTGDEQVDLFCVIDGALYVPGHDPVGATAFGNFYRLGATGWAKVSTIPGVLHTYDLVRYDGRLFAANGTMEMNAVMMSADDGRTWLPVLEEQSRVYDLFVFKGRLYAMKWVYASAKAADNGVDVFDGARFVKANIAGAQMVPGIRSGTLVRMVRTTAFGDELLYIASEYGVNDHQWAPIALYAAPELSEARRLALPQEGALPYDILVRGATVYVLAAERKAGGGHTNLVYASDDLVTWSEVLRFDAATFARSFEEAGGAFYFGLGSEADAVSAATGDILRVRRPAEPVSPAPTRAPSGTPPAPRQYAPLIQTRP